MLEKFQVLTFCWLFHTFWFFMIMMHNLKLFDDWKKLNIKTRPKSQSLTDLDSWLFVRWFKISLMINHGFGNVLNQEIRSRYCIGDFEIMFQEIRSFIEQKVKGTPSSIKTLIGRFKIDLEEMIGIWRLNVDDWWRYITRGEWRLKT